MTAAWCARFECKKFLSLVLIEIENVNAGKCSMGILGWIPFLASPLLQTNSLIDIVQMYS